MDDTTNHDRPAVYLDKSCKKSAWLDSLAVERLEQKALDIFALLDRFDKDWEQVFFIWLCRCLGFKVNADPFQQIGENLSIHLIHKYRLEPIKVEALCFGVGNLLSGGEQDEFPRLLNKEFSYLSKLHALQTIQVPWRLLRMRPYNFPWTRIGQLVAILTQKQFSLSVMLSLQNLDEAKQLFLDLAVNPYWFQHFSFEKPVRQTHSGQFGKEALNVLILNAVIITLFSYGKYFQIEAYMEKAIQFLADLPAEQNRIVNGFQQVGWMAHNAVDSQAMLQLKRCYCDQKQCLNCRIGAAILKS